MPEIPDHVRAAIDENCLTWVRKMTGNPKMTVNQRAQERVYELAGLAYRAGREDAARDLEAEADDEAQRPGRAEPSELIERWLREAAEIARGNQPRTPEAG